MSNGEHREKLAIVGWAASTRKEAPHGDEEFDFWGCNELGRSIEETRWDAWFNLHARGHTSAALMQRLGPWLRSRTPSVDHDIKPESVEWLKAQAPTPVYMLEHFDDIPNSIAYPFEEVFKTFGNYFTSSIAYQMALGMMMGYREIHLYGVDMAYEEEYVYQRGACEYLIGLARGMGIKVYVPEKSMLLKAPWLYGVEMPPQIEGVITETMLMERINANAKFKGEQLVNAYRAEGAELVLNGLLGVVRGAKKSVPQGVA